LKQLDGSKVNAKVAWPHWVETSAADGAITLADINMGNRIWNVFKVTFVKSVAKLGNFIGAFMPHGQPFMKSTGNNEVFVTATFEGAQCW